MCISNKIGPPVEGEDFFGREKEIRKANRLLDSTTRSIGDWKVVAE